MFEMIGLVFIQIFLLILATIGGVICVTFVYLFTRRVPADRSKLLALFVAFVFPFVAIFYAEAGMVAYEVNENISGRDNFFDGFDHYPLVNSYRLRCFYENPADMCDLEPHVAVGEIHGIQVVGDHLFVHGAALPAPGSLPTVTVTHGGVPQPVDQRSTERYLEIDTRTSDVVDHETIDELRSAAARRGATLQLISIEDAYQAALSAAEPDWDFIAFFAILLAPLAVITAWLLRRLQLLRRTAIA